MITGLDIKHYLRIRMCLVEMLYKSLATSTGMVESSLPWTTSVGGNFATFLNLSIGSTSALKMQGLCR